MKPLFPLTRCPAMLGYLESTRSLRGLALLSLCGITSLGPVLEGRLQAARLPETRTAIGLESFSRVGSADLSAVAHGLGRFVVVGDGGTILASTNNGVSWTQLGTTLTNDLLAVAFGQGRFVACGAEGVILVSTNGIVWDAVQSPVSTSLRTVVFGADRWMMGGVGVSLTSADAFHWDAENVTWDFSSVAFGEGKFVAAAGSLLTSTNALQWEVVRPQVVAENYRRIAFGNGRFVAGGYARRIGSTDNGGTIEISPVGMAATSAGGVDWRLAELSVEPLSAVAFCDGWFVLLGSGIFWIGGMAEWGFDQGMAMSPDGLGWSTVGLPLRQSGSPDDFNWGGPYSAVTCGDGCFVFVGRGGSILTGEYRPVILSVKPNELGATVQFVSRSRAPVTIQVSTNLVTWSELKTLAGEGGVQAVDDTEALRAPRRFYLAIQGLCR